MSSVWVMLHIDGEKNSKGQPVEIEPLPRNINALKELAKEKLKPDIDYASLRVIRVYAAKVDRNDLENATPLDAWASVPAAVGNAPLIVRAPSQQQLQQQQQLEPHVRELVEQWKVPYSDGTMLGKRGCENEPHREHKRVKLCPPAQGRKWYLGSSSDSLFLRSSVRDLGGFVLDMVEKFFGKEWPGPFEPRSILFVISGAAGIGKSWSINAFVRDLLGKGRRVFLHLGETNVAYLISKSNTEKVEPNMIKTPKYTDAVYVYDSPGSKQDKGSSEAVMRLEGASLIFSSPKRRNYRHAYDKNSGYNAIKNIPAWTKEEMLEVAPNEKENVEASFRIWGGNMRAYERFRGFSDVRDAKAKALAQLDAQIKCFDADFTEKMSEQLFRHDVDRKLYTEEFNDAPGHVLVPEPVCVDPSKSNCFEDFRWRFCSPLAEKKFYAHLKKSMKDVMTSLLQKVFGVPSSKGVLFEKVSHLLLTSGVVEKFQSYKFTDKGATEWISFPECEIWEFGDEGKTLQQSLEAAIKKLQEEQGTIAIALEPSDPNFDAVDMFVLVKSGTTNSYKDWKLFMLQDTIARKHSLHPVKVLWYCAVFCDTLKGCLGPESLDDSIILEQCSYVAVVPAPHAANLSFKEPSSTSDWTEVERVAKLLDLKLPHEGESESVVEKDRLDIPKTKDGKQKKPTKPIVGNALILENACSKVLDQCRVIFNVVAV